MKNLNLLRLSGIISFALAFFQAVISFSPSWSLYFGAPPELADNPLLLIMSGIFISIIFIIFGLYGLSGAGDIRPLPLIRSGLITIGCIYTSRGLLIVFQLLIIFEVVPSDEVVTPQLLVSSVVSLIIGIIYFLGTINNWSRLNQLSLSRHS